MQIGHKKGSAAIAYAVLALLLLILVLTFIPAAKQTVLEILGVVSK